MLGYRKRSFAQAHGFLEALRADTANLTALRSLQVLLLSELGRAERKIRELKGVLKGVQAAANATSAKRSSYLQNRIARVRDVAYFWRSFGDAIAFLYMSKHAIKQTYFNADNPNPKQGSGFVIDKEGLPNEIQLVEHALQHKVPALLVDITNTLRHGDVCLMSGPDPHLIEVKSARKVNNRGLRQRQAIANLQRFFETDEVENLRGLGKVRRVEGDGSEKNYVKEFNDCLIEARESGSCVMHPEPGVTYIAVGPGGDIIKALGQTSFKKPWGIDLNGAKIAHAWSPYEPFTLSIRGKDELWAFARGELYAVVMIDTENFVTIAKRHGCEATLNMDDPAYPLRLKIEGTELEGAGLSAQLLLRIGMEFVSPEWLISSSIALLKGVYESEAAKGKAN